VANKLNKVTVVSAEMEREYYTKHGLHYNRKGKKIMARKILTVIQEITGLQSENDDTPDMEKYNA
jgi:lysophospholipase L1-like esterase